jgi:hypothetical protein
VAGCGVCASGRAATTDELLLKAIAGKVAARISARRLQPIEAQLLNDVDILEEAGAAEYGVHNHSPHGASNCGHLQMPGDTAF